MSSQSSTPAQSSSKYSKPKSKAPRSSRDESPFFTQRMQDTQARNKDPYASDSSDSPYEGSSRKYDAYGNDSYEQIQKRREAAIVLDSPDLLMMHAQARNDSIPGTRHYFTKMLCGYLGENESYEKFKAPPADKEPEKEMTKSKHSKGKGKATQ